MAHTVSNVAKSQSCSYNAANSASLGPRPTESTKPSLESSRSLQESTRPDERFAPEKSHTSESTRTERSALETLLDPRNDLGSLSFESQNDDPFLRRDWSSTLYISKLDLQPKSHPKADIKFTEKTSSNTRGYVSPLTPLVKTWNSKKLFARPSPGTSVATVKPQVHQAVDQTRDQSRDKVRDQVKDQIRDQTNRDQANRNRANREQNRDQANEERDQAEQRDQDDTESTRGQKRANFSEIIKALQSNQKTKTAQSTGAGKQARGRRMRTLNMPKMIIAQRGRKKQQPLSPDTRWKQVLEIKPINDSQSSGYITLHS